MRRELTALFLIFIVACSTGQPLLKPSNGEPVRLEDVALLRFNQGLYSTVCLTKLDSTVFKSCNETVVVTPGKHKLMLSGGVGSTIKYIFADAGKIYQISLIRKLAFNPVCDVSVEDVTTDKNLGVNSLDRKFFK